MSTQKASTLQPPPRPLSAGGTEPTAVGSAPTSLFAPIFALRPAARQHFRSWLCGCRPGRSRRRPSSLGRSAKLGLPATVSTLFGTEPVSSSMRAEIVDGLVSGPPSDLRSPEILDQWRGSRVVEVEDEALRRLRRFFVGERQSAELGAHVSWRSRALRFDESSSLTYRSGNGVFGAGSSALLDILAVSHGPLLVQVELPALRYAYLLEVQPSWDGAPSVYLHDVDLVRPVGPVALDAHVRGLSVLTSSGGDRGARVRARAALFGACGARTVDPAVEPGRTHVVMSGFPWDRIAAGERVATALARSSGARPSA